MGAIHEFRALLLFIFEGTASWSPQLSTAYHIGACTSNHLNARNSHLLKKLDVCRSSHVRATATAVLPFGFIDQISLVPLRSNKVSIREEV